MSEIDKPQGNGATEGLSQMVGKKCIVRTYSAGVWFGEIEEKAGNLKMGRSVRYRRETLERWLAQFSEKPNTAAQGGWPLIYLI